MDTATQLLLLLVFRYEIASGLQAINLGGTWSVQNSVKGYNLTGTVPGGIYTDLQQSKLIKDVFYGFNDLNYRWVSKTNWTYSRTFVLNEETLHYSNVHLVFDGIDTFAEIFLNDKKLGDTENMFVKYVFQVKENLLVGSNTLSVAFKSPVNIAKEEYEKQLKDHAVPPYCVPNDYNGECHVNHVRKMQASFAWDWGPAFPSVGIWKRVYIQAFNSSTIDDVTVTVTGTNSSWWNVEFSTYFSPVSIEEYVQGTLVIQLETDSGNITKISKVNLKKNEHGEYVDIQNIRVYKNLVQLWWPNGYGNPKLYSSTITFISPNKSEKSHKALLVGFRTIELIQNPLSKYYKGRTFYFKINGAPIFAKGSNLIPISILPELNQNENNIKFLLESARDVHMNMLRVWGGGIYLSDEFYQLADQLGIMIWQDFMFACSMYPASDGFLKKVQLEIKQQVRRLQRHPCVVVWAGNNENEAALRENWYGTSSNFSIYKDDYKKLYVDVIENEVLKNDQSRPFLTSSPTNGINSIEQDYIADNPQSPYFGDVHFYNYILDSWNVNVYPVSRFVSEYGYQSLPSLETLKTATRSADDLKIWSDFLIKRQHHPGGYSQMLNLIDFQLRLPGVEDPKFLQTFTYYSQVMQAQGIKIQSEFYRTWRSDTDDSGKGLTMGALYWQLNDVWVAPTWSSIDFNNNWKMLHYFAKDFFAPVIITGRLTPANDLQVYVVSDLMSPVLNATAQLSIFRWDSFVSVYERSYVCHVMPGISDNVISIPRSQFLETTKTCGKNPLNKCLVYLSLKDDQGNTVAPSNYIFLSPLKLSSLQAPTLEITNVRQIDKEGKIFEITIKTDGIALFVWLDAVGIPGRFSENGFLQLVTSKSVNFYSSASLQLDVLKESLTVRHLLNAM